MSSSFKRQAPSSDSTDASSKRVKFNSNVAEAPAIQGDPELEANEASTKRRRGALNTDGYGSDDDVDSDVGEVGEDEDEDEDAREAQRSAARSRRGAGGDDEDDEDEDMFAMSDNEGKDKKSKKEKDESVVNEKKFLRLGDIEGQEFGTGDKASDEEEADPDLQLEDSEEDAASSLADDEAAAAERTPPTSPGGTVIRTARREKAKQTHGFALEGFNMKNEFAQGRFDEEGNYSANAADPHAEHDAWLRGNYSKRRIKEAREAKEKREREREEAERRKEAEALGEDETKRELVLLMQPGETVLEALQRYGAKAKREKSRKTVVRRKKPEGSHGEVAGETATLSDVKGKGKQVEAEPLDPNTVGVSRITELSSALMSQHGMINIYDEPYEALLRAVRRSGLERGDWDPARSRAVVPDATANAESSKSDPAQDSRKFSYRWSPSYLASTGTPVSPEMEVFGPFAATELKEWASSGYFGERGERVLLRAEEGGSWMEWLQVFGA